MWKKMVVLLCLMLCMTLACAEGMDLSTMTEEELLSLRDQIDARLDEIHGETGDPVDETQEETPEDPYETLPYEQVSRNPDQHEGKMYRFTGVVLQVLEDSTYADTLGVYTVLRVASRGSGDDVVYVEYWRPKAESRILEKDRVTVSGVCGGVYTYETVMHSNVTIPQITADSVVLATETKGEARKVPFTVKPKG